jgi:hypothetical protein
VIYLPALLLALIEWSWRRFVFQSKDQKDLTLSQL